MRKLWINGEFTDSASGLTGVRHGMAILREEIFGPVAPVMTFKTFDEALALANDSPYGLGACLYSNDPRRVRRYFEEIQVGNVWVNDPLVDNPAGRSAA